MSVNGGRYLTVWGQSEGTGTWNITKPDTSCAGIGGYVNVSGNITINGGVINVTGAENAAGIGAGGFAPDSDGVITINGGTVNAKGGHSGAGIGGGNAATTVMRAGSSSTAAVLPRQATRAVRVSAPGIKATPTSSSAEEP